MKRRRIQNGEPRACFLTAIASAIALGSFFLTACPTETTSTYAVRYDGNGSTGGNVPTDPHEYQKGASVTVLGNSGNLEKTNYIYSGWNTRTDGSGSTYTQGSTFTMGGSNVTLYARWGPVISTVAGTGGVWGYSGDGGPATSALLSGPTGVVVDASGNLYISDYYNNRIRKVDTTGKITTVAGNGTYGYSGDGGPATSAAIGPAVGVAVDTAGNIYIPDEFNNRVRKVDTSGTITTVAGDGTQGFSGDGGPAASAQLWYPAGVALDAAGNLFIADNENLRIRKVNAAGTITTVAGAGLGGSMVDGIPATSAFIVPWGVAVDTAGNIYIDEGGCVRKVDAAGTITRVAGVVNTLTGGVVNGYYAGDGVPATSALLNYNKGVAIDAYGNIYIADTSNSRIRKVDAGGIITTVAGGGYAGSSADGIPATTAYLIAPTGVAVDASGNIYIADSGDERIRKVSPP